MQRRQPSALQTGSQGNSYLSFCPRISCWRFLLGRPIWKPENQGAQMTQSTVQKGQPPGPWSREGRVENGAEGQTETMPHVRVANNCPPYLDCHHFVLSLSP